MALDKLHLNKLLKLMFLPEGALTSALRSDIREQLTKQAGDVTGGGGNFYEPFWFDVKQHLSGIRDISVATEERISANDRRKNLYPLLKNGFLEILKRGGNQEIAILDAIPKGKVIFDDLGLIIKVENILPLNIEGQLRLAYPYWFQRPKLTNEAIRVGLWVIGQALDNYQIQDIRIYDAFGMTYFSAENNPLLGNEKEILTKRYMHLISRRQELMSEYDD